MILIVDNEGRQWRASSWDWFSQTVRLYNPEHYTLANDAWSLYTNRHLPTLTDVIFPLTSIRRVLIGDDLT